MNIESVSISNFKNLGGVVSCFPGINLIIGSNGFGKTNFLELINYLGRAESFRHSNERYLINWMSKTAFLKVESNVRGDDGLKKFEYIVSDDVGILRKKLLIDGLQISRNKFIHTLPIIYFLPQNIDLISGSPENRRSELDDFISMIDDGFKVKISDYKKILINRNKLLKSIRDNKSSREELYYWNEGLIISGSEIISKRIEILDQLLPVVKNLAQQIFHEDLRSLNYLYDSKLVDNFELSLDEIIKNFRGKVENGYYKELASGITLYGPQRDDIVFYANKMNLHESGSRGQQRLVSLIFKVAMWEYYKDKFETKPIILLDDVMSELDDSHSKNLENALLNLDTQVFATSTNKKEFSGKFLKLASFVQL